MSHKGFGAQLKDSCVLLPALFGCIDEGEERRNSVGRVDGTVSEMESGRYTVVMAPCF
jgi:hypothetical protein